MHRILSFSNRAWHRIKELFTRRPWVSALGVVIIIGALGGALWLIGQQGDADSDVTGQLFPVELIPVSEFAAGAGSVVSPGGAEEVLRAEASGRITRVLPEGTRVGAGTVVAEFENSSQQAALLQAEGALEAARASAEKTESGPRSEKIAVLTAAYASARSGSVATILSAFGTIDSAVRDTADQMLSNPESTVPILIFQSSNSQRRVDIQNTRVLLGATLKREASASNSLSIDSDLEAELERVENELRDTRAFIDAIIAALNEAIPTGDITDASITAFKADATAARTALTTALSSIAASRASLETSKQNLDEGLTGSEATDIAAAGGAVKQSQGAYNAALAAYQKTIVRARTGGTVVSCNAAVGDVLSVGADVCRIRTLGGVSGGSFILPLSSVKYTPAGAFVFVVDEHGTLDAIEVTTGLVASDGITVSGLFGDEHIVRDVRGLKSGETVRIQ